MNNKKPDTQFIGKVHKILLDDSVRAGVRTSAIAQDNKGTGVRVLPLQMILPYSCDVVTDKLGSIMADSQRHVADIPGHVIDAVRNNLTVGEGGEVVVKGFEWTVGQSLSLPLEVPQHLFLLGVDADDGKSRRLRLFADGRDAQELIITVPDLLHGKVLIEGTLLKAKGVKDLSDKVARDVVSDCGKFTHDLCDTQGYPYHILILREASRMRFDYLYDSLRPLGMLGKHTLAPGSLFSNAAIAGTFSGEELPSSFLKSMCACSHNFTNFAVAEPLSLEVCGLGCQETSFVSFVQRRDIRHIAWREDFWRSFRDHLQTLGLMFKVTKNLPDFLYYIIDNQQIKSNLCYFFQGSEQSGFSSSGTDLRSLKLAA